MLHEYLPKTRHMSQEDLMEWMPDNYPEDMICANCAHFAEAVPITVPLGGRLLERRLCLHAEFYVDAGQGSITLVAPESDCLGAGTCAFTPSESCLAQLSALSPKDDNGVYPGLDYPVTLCR